MIVPESAPFRHAQSSMPATWTAPLSDRTLACSFRLRRIVVSLTGMPSRLISRSEGRPPALWPSSRTIPARRAVSARTAPQDPQALGEDAPTTPLGSTPPARQACVNDDRCSLSGQIPKRSRVSAVTRFGLRTASRTRSRLPAVHRDLPSLFFPLDPHDVQAWRG